MNVKILQNTILFRPIPFLSSVNSVLIWVYSSTNSLILAHLHPLNCETTFSPSSWSIIFTTPQRCSLNPINYPRRFFHPLLEDGGNFFNVDIGYLGRGLASLSFPSPGDAISGSCLPLRGSVSANSYYTLSFEAFFFLSFFFSELSSWDFRRYRGNDSTLSPRQVVKSGLLNRFIRVSFLSFPFSRKRQVSRCWWKDIARFDGHFVRFILNSNCYSYNLIIEEKCNYKEWNIFLKNFLENKLEVCKIIFQSTKKYIIIYFVIRNRMNNIILSLSFNYFQKPSNKRRRKKNRIHNPSHSRIFFLIPIK